MIKRKKRTASEFARIYGSKARVQFVARMACANCRLMGGWLRIVNAHTETGGVSRKGAYTTIIPLCSMASGGGCHDVQHRTGWSFLVRLDTPEKRKAAAAATERAWLASRPPLEASPK